MYKKLLLFLSFTLILLNIKSEECDKLGILLYEDLRCKPQITEGNSCPTHFECAEFTKSNQSCLFQAEEIPVGGNVNDSLIYSSCRIGCHCIFNENKDMADFNCAVLDCPEALVGELNNPECYLTYTPGQCCSTGQKCPPFDNITKCVVEGREYKQGELFYPSNTCLSCVCKENFNGKFEEPFCQRRTCAEDIDNAEKLAENCAPVYFSTETLCCPSEWACSSGDDQIRQINSKSAPESNLTCRWGDQSLKLGEGLETRIEHFDELKNVTCECVLPPFLTCKETKK